MKLINYLKLFCFYAALIFLIPLVSVTNAADFESSYKVRYQLVEDGVNINSKAHFLISIVNNRSDVYVNRFSISFPKSFTISNLKITDDNGEVTPKIENDDEYNKIEMEFNNPNIGRGSINNFNLTFDQANLFKVNGNVWEVILPVIENRGNSSYDVTVILPENESKKISIAKPQPSSIQGREIKWINPTTRTIYAVFGESQLYSVNLAYNLKNTKLTPVLMEVALPPDTQYQKVTLNSISAKPEKVYQDQDGNFMNVFKLKPRETKTINTKLTIEVFTNPREEVAPFVANAFESQKKYLLNSQKYWEIKSLEKISEPKTVDEIYYFVTKHLKYSYDRVTKDNVRLGAELILQKPEIAVCMEFTDLFVAMSREKGIYSREIEGYGSSSDSRLRPLSLSSDILHAWPEYYDEAAGLWRPVDPTWENTSGIDYFNSFDLNHIVFAIHGKDSEYPRPAGMYKVENSKDIEVTAVTGRTPEKKQLEITEYSIPAKLTGKEGHKGKFYVVNTGNTYAWDIPVNVQGTGLEVKNGKSTILSLAPGEKKEINFEFNISDDEKIRETSLKVLLADDIHYQQKISIVSPVISIVFKAIGGMIFILTLLFVSKRLLFKSK